MPRRVQNRAGSLDSIQVSDNSSDGWICAEGYAGIPYKECTLKDEWLGEQEPAEQRVCEFTTALRGCFPLQPCVGPQEDSCAVAKGHCSTISAGGNCTLECQAGYHGTPTMATCPIDNTDPTRLADWIEPVCVFDNVCPEPEPPPNGYQRLEDGSWACDVGWKGAAFHVCRARPNCAKDYVLAGCYPNMPCSVPALSTCGLDLSDCGVMIGPGATCELRCAPGYSGNPTHAACPATNEDLNGGLAFELPACEFQGCEYPDPAPPGYTRRTSTANGTTATTTLGSWECAPGYIGEVRQSCTPCTAQLAFSGCAKLEPCAPLALDPCRYNTTDCHSVLPGASCHLACRHPYGNSSEVRLGSCPAGNTDALQGLIFNDTDSDLAAQCMLECREPAAVDGYRRVTGGVGGWECADGWLLEVGMPPPGLCEVTDICNANQDARFVLSGCRFAAPCSMPEVEACTLDTSACGRSLAAGTSCNITCMAPLTGGVGSAACPENNSVVGGEPVWSPPVCPPLSCLDVVPPGYMKTAVGWECAIGYAGTAVASCTSDVDCCGSMLHLDGCLPLQPCGDAFSSLALDALDDCITNIRDCGSLPAGESCEVHCRGPAAYGRAAMLTCPADNVNATSPPMYTTAPPDCRLRCNALTYEPAGYRRHPVSGDWLCEDTHVGIPLQSCKIANMRTCETRYELAGCFALAHCTIPAEVDVCRYDTSDCSSVPAGGLCELPCRAPYTGGSTTAQCPAGNTEAGRSVDFKLPSCVPQCADASEPEGYVLAGGEWRCAVGFTGIAVKGCSFARPPACTPTAVFSGCEREQPCLEPAVEASDVCRYDVSACIGLKAGMRCLISCRQPYVGQPAQGLCPPGNTDPNRMLVWSGPQCFCGDPSSPPAQYNKTPTGWTCADGYTGRALRSCELGPTHCINETLLTGCTAPVACMAMPFRDTDSRVGFARGSLRFGPAQPAQLSPPPTPIGDIGINFAPEVNEVGVSGYHVFFADSCGRRLGNGSEPIATVVRGDMPLVGGCCSAGLYRLRLEGIRVPAGAEQLLIFASLPSGLSADSRTVPFVDSVGDGTGAPSGAAPVHVGALAMHIALFAVTSLQS